MKVLRNVLWFSIATHSLCNLGLALAAADPWPSMNFQGPVESGVGMPTRSQRPQFLDLLASISQFLEQLSPVQQSPASAQQALSSQPSDHVSTSAPVRLMDTNVTDKAAGLTRQVSHRVLQKTGRGRHGGTPVFQVQVQAPNAAPTIYGSDLMATEPVAVGAAEAPSVQHHDPWEEEKSQTMSHPLAPLPDLDHTSFLLPATKPMVETPVAEYSWNIELPLPGPSPSTSWWSGGVHPAQDRDSSSAMSPAPVTISNLADGADSPSGSSDSSLQDFPQSGGPTPFLISVEQAPAPVPHIISGSGIPTSPGPLESYPYIDPAASARGVHSSTDTQYADSHWHKQLALAPESILPVSAPIPTKVSPIVAPTPNTENAQILEPSLSDSADPLLQAPVVGTGVVPPSQGNFPSLPSAGPDLSYETSAQPVLLASGRNQQDPGFSLIKAVYALIQANPESPVSVGGPVPLADAKALETTATVLNSKD